MSVLEDLQGLKNRVRERVRELRPLVAELEQLEAVAQRLGIDVGDGAEQPEQPEQPEQREQQEQPARPAGAASAPRRGSRRRTGDAARSRPATRQRGGRARAGSRQEQLLSLVRENPGITVREAGQRLGVDGTSLYRVVHRLEREGAVTKEGTQLQPAAGDAVQ
jgi:hypothetical protein